MTAAKNVMDFSRSAVSRYVQLATLFRRRIESGQWKVGAQIPTVEELVTECGVARATIRQALGMLEQEGLINRFRAKGTFVTRRPQEQLWCEVETDWSGLLRSREGAVIEMLSDLRDQQPHSIPHAIGEVALRYRHLKRRHLRDGVPFLLADVYIDERWAERITPQHLTTKTALKLVADIPGLEIVDARQTLTLGSVDIEISRYLNLPLNTPIAFVHRTAVAADGTIAMIGEGIYRGDVVRIDFKLR